MFANHGIELVEVCNKEKLSIWEYTLKIEEEQTGLNREAIIQKMKKNLKIMK